jgi:preprotein translocase subunit SecE
MMIDRIKLVFSFLLVGFGVTGFYLLEEKQPMAFSRDAVAEAKRVVWPSRRETIQTTVAVFVLVVVMALFMWIVDVGFLSLVKALMGRGA